MPDATNCSDQTTMALAPQRNRIPVMASVRQSRPRDGSLMPSGTMMAASSSPAIRNRTPANRNGGRWATPIRMKR